MFPLYAHWPLLPLQSFRAQLAISQVSVSSLRPSASHIFAVVSESACDTPSERSLPCRPSTPAPRRLLHLVKQGRYASPQCPLAVFAYEVILWRIFDDFLRHVSAPVLPSSVAGSLLVLGVMAAAWVHPHGNCAHRGMVVVCAL
jgi:hypothetical protein